VDIGRWLHAIFTPQAAYGQTPAQSAPVAAVAPVSRAGNTYAGRSLPVGVSSLQASSEDSRGKRVVRDKPPAAGPRLKNLDKRAGELVSNLFAGHGVISEQYPGVGRAPSDRWVDEMLDRIGFFDPYQGGTLNDRRQRAIQEWNRKIGVTMSGRR
jgi:hypothetical protein